jgi:hypothetical protein
MYGGEDGYPIDEIKRELGINWGFWRKNERSSLCTFEEAQIKWQ